MINQFRKEMPRPLIGIGHSMGGNHLYVFEDPILKSLGLS